MQNNRINVLRESINKMILNDDLSSSEIIQASQELDKLIIEYYYDQEKSLNIERELVKC